MGIYTAPSIFRPGAISANILAGTSISLGGSTGTTQAGFFGTTALKQATITDCTSANVSGMEVAIESIIDRLQAFGLIL